MMTSRIAGPAAVDSAAARDTAFFGHPRGLRSLCGAEFWERFSYYGMQALLVLYMTHELLLPGHVERVLGFGGLRSVLESFYGPLTPHALASVIFGWYAGLVYVTPIVGGLLADRLLGSTRTVIVGACLMAAGHFMMACDASFLIALGCLLLGAGCFKGNLAAQLGRLYANGDPRGSNGFQLYFFAVNLAVIVAPLVCGTLGERSGYHWGFGAAGVGMLVGLAVYLRALPWLPREPARSGTTGSQGAAPWLPGDARRLMVLLALLPLLGVALVGNFQLFNAYLIWAEANYQLHVFGGSMPVTWILSFGSGIAMLSLVGSAMFWRRWAAKRAEPSEITKMAVGAIFLGLAPLVLVYGAHTVAATGEKIGLGWAVIFEIVNDIGYANLLPVGLALYSRAAPRAVAGMMVGIYYVLLFFANVLVGWLGGLQERMPATRFWLLHSAVVFGAALTLLALRGSLTRLFAGGVVPAVLPEDAALIPEVQ